MNEQIWQAIQSAGFNTNGNCVYVPEGIEDITNMQEKFAETIIKVCIDAIESHQIPVGNSASGELACEWTYAALTEIRDDIKARFGVE